MLRFLIGRILAAVPVLLILSIVTFATQHLLSRWRNQSPDGYEEAASGTGEAQGGILRGFLKTMVAVTVFSLLFLLQHRRLRLNDSGSLACSRISYP